MTFEQTLNRIDEIIKLLSDGDIPLEQAVELYKEGTQSIADCSKKLDDAQNEILKVTEAEIRGGENENGT